MLGDLLLFQNLSNLILKDSDELFADRIVETGFRKAFKGNWGASAHTKRLGVIQGLNRLSYNAAVSHLRKINLPLDAPLRAGGLIVGVWLGMAGVGRCAV